MSLAAQQVVAAMLGMIAAASALALPLVRDRRHGRRVARMIETERGRPSADRAGPEPRASERQAPIALETRKVLRAAGFSFDDLGGTLRPLHVGAAAAAAAALGLALTLLLLRLPWWAGAAASLPLSVGGAWLAFRMARERRRARFLDHFPDALDLIVRAVRAGLPVVEALLAVGRDVPEPVGGEFRHVSDQLQIGIPLEDALWQAADRLGIADFRIFVVSLSLQQETGGTLAEALNNLASVIRQRKGLRLKAKALSAEAKASALVISALPFFAGGALCMVNPDYVARFVSDPQGGYLLGAALAQITLGILVMRFLIKRSVR